VFHRDWPDWRVLVAAGAGADLGTAFFNAPIAGAVFVLEGLVQRFEHRIAIAAPGGLGAVAGVLTICYKRVLLATRAAAHRLARAPV
jgi:chloride channel protein, CIC family